MSLKPTTVLSLREWQTKTVASDMLSTRDWELARQFGENSRQLRLEALRNGIRITTYSWIGVVRLDSVEFRIEPKLAGDHVRVVEMLEWASGVSLLKRFDQSHEIEADSENLYDLIALLLVDEAERLVQAGLLTDYRTEEDLLGVVRGRLLVDRQILQRFGQVDRIYCRFDDLTQDIPENQIVAAALATCQHWVSGRGLRLRIRRCLDDFLSCCNPAGTHPDELLSRLNYDRLNQHYQSAHQLSALVLQRSGVSEMPSTGSTNCFSFLLNMNKLFEEFVEALLRKILRGSGVRLSFQFSDSSIIRDADTGAAYARVIPDALVYSPNSTSRVSIDAKYKRLDEFKVDNADIYQSFLYAFAYGGNQSRRSAMIVYPCSSSDGERRDLQICGGGDPETRVSVIGIHIPTAIDALSNGSIADDGFVGQLRSLILSRLETGSPATVST